MMFHGQAAAWGEATNLQSIATCQYPGEEMATKYRVIKVKGSNPESFVVVGIDFAEHTIKSTSIAMAESELRDHLRQAGATVEEIQTWVEQGRAYPGE
jgi:hypothetical protein